MTAVARRDRMVGYACAIAVLFVWAGFIISARAGARTGLTPWDMGALRYAGSLAAALPLVFLHGAPRLSLVQVATILATACFGFALLAYLGFGAAPASHGAVLLPGVLPFASAFVMWAALGERPGARRFLALLITAAGIALLAWDTFGGVPGAWRGDLLMVGATGSFALYMLAVRVWRIPARDATLAMCLYAAPVFLPVWLLLPSRIWEAPLSVLAWQCFMQGVLAVLVANYLFTRAMLALGPGRLTAITALVPGLAALGAWAALGEPVGPAGLAGIALVSCATVIGAVGRPRVDSPGAAP